MKMIFEPTSRLIENTTKKAYMCAICDKSILLNHDNMNLPILSDFRDPAKLMPLWQIGTLGDVPCVACPINKNDAQMMLLKDFVWVNLRTLFHTCDVNVSCAASRAAELLFWRESHQYCGHCGGKLILCDKDVSLSCSACSSKFYPQIAPAVIVLIKRGSDEILLAHNRNFAPGVFSLIAGFVEAGESAEQAIHREIMEEIGIEVTNIQYAGSQCWPYPNSLMLGFTAEYLTGEIIPDGTEIETAGFFSRKNMPIIPKPGSIASRLINEWIDKRIQ